MATGLFILMLPASAHLGPEGSLTSGDKCRWEGDPGICFGTDGVSGTYVTYHENFFLTGGDFFPLTLHDQTGGITGDTTIFPFGYASAAFAWCDLEVQGDGTTKHPLDEERVDDEPGGLLIDGLWDDGGMGGACHTEARYNIDAYNTPGCGTGGTHAVAEDAISGGSVWIGAACDETTRLGDPVSVELCLYNAAISTDTGRMFDCINNHLGPAGGDPVIICGSDSVADAINYGPGGGRGSQFGIAFPSTGCPEGSPVVFTYNYVSVGGSPCPPSSPPVPVFTCAPKVVPATTGWIDSRDGLSDPLFPGYGPGLVI